VSDSLLKADEAHEAVLVAAAAKAGADPVLVYRPGEFPGAAVLASLREPTSTHPKTDGDVLYVTTRPLEIGGRDGTATTLGVGEVLTPSEVEQSGSALAALVGHGHLAALPVDSGIVGAVAALLRRCARLEAVIQLGSLSDDELKQLARDRGLIGAS